MTGPRLYGELAGWFHLVTNPEDYEEEAGIFTQVLRDHSHREVRTLLELGSGGGNNASHMKHHFHMTLTDLSQEMLAVSRKLNPECEHLPGDMRTLRLDRTFDAVFVHDAVAYLTTEADLEAAMRTAYVHLDTGGVALFVPDDTTENFRAKTTCGGHDHNGRSLRYLMWTHPLKDTVAEVTFVIVRREGGHETVETDQHMIGVFPRATWISLLERTGFEVAVLPYHLSEFAHDAGHELFAGLKR